MTPGGVKLRLRRSQEVRGSLELHNGGLRALEEAWMTTSRLRHFPVKCGRFMCLFGRVQGWLREVWQGRGQSKEVQGSLELQNGGLRALEDAWMTTFRLRQFSVPGHPWMQGFPITRPAFGSIWVRPAMVI